MEGVTLISRQNNIGFLRLLFASMVIVSHSAEMIDGNRSREALTSLLGILTLGEVAVFGFFLVSGYLIVQSFERSTSIWSYFWKRVRRIVPGFLVAYFICVYAVGPLAGVNLSEFSLKEHVKILFNGLLLQPPSIPAFFGLPFPGLNGAMWSIAFEFRCYLLVILFSLLGLYKNRWVFLATTLVFLGLTAFQVPLWVPSPVRVLVGEPTLLVRMLGMFCAGTCFYLFRDVIRYNFVWAVGALIGLFLALYAVTFSEAAFAIAGGYLIFWFGLAFRSDFLSRVNADTDISYGVYLYAWPLQMLLIYYLQTRSPLLVTALALPAALLAGYQSWILVERPFLRLGAKLVAHPARFGD